MNGRFFLLVALLLSALCVAQAMERVSQYTRDKLARELPTLSMAVGDPVFIRTFKKEAQLELWIRPKHQTNFVLFRTYPICYYSGSLGPKQRQGDAMTPEGFYKITAQNLQPYSRFHLSMDIGYPNAYDRYHGRTGSLLMIHGACDARGCFAMGNAQIEEIYYLVAKALSAGQKSVPVHAFPFHLSDTQLKHYQQHPWYNFWQQLQQGYQAFNRSHQPPLVRTKKGEYVISEHR